MHLFSTNDDVATILFEPMIFEEEEEGRERKAAGADVIIFRFPRGCGGGDHGSKGYKFGGSGGMSGRLAGRWVVRSIV